MTFNYERGSESPEIMEFNRTPRATLLQNYVRIALPACVKVNQRLILYRARGTLPRYGPLA